MIPANSYSRLAIGMIVLTHVIAYNESGAITVLFSAFISTISAICSGKVTIFHTKYRFLFNEGFETKKQFQLAKWRTFR